MDPPLRAIPDRIRTVAERGRCASEHADLCDGRPGRRYSSFVRTLGEDRENYETVKTKFDSHFVQRRNVIFERARFNRRRQEEGEPVESFITALYSLAEHCGYGNLHDEMIRDRIVVGIRNNSLSEKLQLDRDSPWTAPLLRSDSQKP